MVLFIFVFSLKGQMVFVTPYSYPLLSLLSCLETHPNLRKMSASLEIEEISSG